MSNLTSIVKVQRPITTTEPQAMVLIYNAGRDKSTHQPLTPELLTKFNGEYKKFFHATWSGGQWTIGDPAPWQEW